MSNLQVFQFTSDKPYDQCDYKLVFNNKKTIKFDNYYDLYYYWMTNNKDDFNYVEVITKNNSKKTSGFG